MCYSQLNESTDHWYSLAQGFHNNSNVIVDILGPVTRAHLPGHSGLSVTALGVRWREARPDEGV